MKDPYYDRPECSNSDLSSLKKYFYPDFFDHDPTEAYRFGNLIDAMITEPSKLNYFNLTVTDYETPFTKEQWAKAENMKKSAYKDDYTKKLLGMSEFQKICVGDIALNYGNFPFSLRMRCKFDMWMPILGWGADIKSTACTSQKQFEDACYHFDYDRSRVVYMLLSGAERDMVIGISKENYKVFKIPVVRGDAFWNSGMDKLTDLAFKWWCLFENVNLNVA